MSRLFSSDLTGISQLPVGLDEWAKYPRVHWQWAEKPGGWSAWVGGPEAQGHMWATHILTEKFKDKAYALTHWPIMQDLHTHIHFIFSL